MVLLTEIVQNCLNTALAHDAMAEVVPINHVTAAIYSSPPPSRKSALNEMKRSPRPNGFKQIPFHNDQVWSYKSKSNTPKFEYGKNSQTKNSCVCVLTWGDNRQLLFRKCWKVPSTNSPDRDEKKTSFVQCFQLGHMSLFILHPGDEEPKKRDLDSFLSQFEHGDIKFGVEGTLSCALIFRSVTGTVVVNTIDSKLVPTKERNVRQQ